MPFATRIEHPRIDPASIIAHKYAEKPVRIFDFYLDVACVCMQKSIHNSLTANAINFITDQRMQGTGCARGNDPIASLFIEREFLADARKSSLEAQTDALRRAQPSECAPTLFRNLAHQLKNAS